MIIKSFTADSVAAALKDVRKEMGGDAVVLNTRQLTDGDSAGKVEVTACIDSPVIPDESVSLPVVDRAEIVQMAAEDVTDLVSLDEPVETIKPEREMTAPETDSAELLLRLSAIEIQLRALGDMRSIYQNVRQLPEPLRAVRESLAASDLPESDITELCRAALSRSTHLSNIRKSVRVELQKRLDSYVATEFEVSLGQSVLFIGPPGTGKTTVMGKLAARLIVSQKTKVKFISLGATKVGAVDELQSFADILGGDLSLPGDLDHLEVVSDAVSLIDAPAISRIPEPAGELLMAIQRIKPDYRVMVFSALTRVGDLPALIEMMMPFSPTHLAVTMTDLTRSWGTAITLCKRTGAKLALVNDAPSGVGSLSSPDARKILDQLLGESESDHA